MTGYQVTPAIPVARLLTIIIVLAGWLLTPALSAPQPVARAAAEPRPNEECEGWQEGQRQLIQDGQGKLDDDGIFAATIWIIQLECKRVQTGEIEEPPGSGLLVPEYDYRWREIAEISQPVPRGHVRLEHGRALLTQSGLYNYYGRTCIGATGWGWRGTFAEPDQIDRPSQLQPHVFGVDLVWIWQSRRVATGGRLICEPTDTSLIQAHVRHRRGNILLQQFPENYDQYDIAGAVAARVAGYPYRDLVRIGVAPPQYSLPGLPTYFWYEGLDQAPLFGDTVQVGPAGAPLVAKVLVSPAETSWNRGDGAPFSSELSTRRGVPWPQAVGADGSPDPQAISYIFSRDSRSMPGGAFLVTASVRWSGRWSLLEEFQPLGGYTPVILSFADNQPIFFAPPVTVLLERPVVVREARPFLVSDELPMADSTP